MASRADSPLRLLRLAESLRDRCSNLADLISDFSAQPEGSEKAGTIYDGLKGLEALLADPDVQQTIEDESVVLGKGTPFERRVVMLSRGGPFGGPPPRYFAKVVDWLAGTVRKTLVDVSLDRTAALTVALSDEFRGYSQNFKHSIRLLYEVPEVRDFLNERTAGELQTGDWPAELRGAAKAASAKRSTPRGGARAKLIVADAGPGEVPPAIRVLSVYSNGLVGERLTKVTEIVASDSMNANDKLERIDALIPIPATASANVLGEMLGVTAPAIIKTDWWTRHRRGRKAEETEQRRDSHRQRAENETQQRQGSHRRRAKQFEPDRPADE